MKRSYNLVIAILVLMFAGLGFTPKSLADEGVDAQAQAALETAIVDAKTRKENAKDQRFAFTTRVETGDEDNPLVEFTFDPQKPYEDRVTIIHPTMDENPKALEKILKQKQKTLEKRKKEGTQATQDRDLIVNVSRKFLAASNVRFVRETKTEYIFAITPASVNLAFGGEKDDKKDAKGNDKKKVKKNKDNKFAKYMKGEIAVGKEKQRFLWMRFYSTEAFKPAAVAKIKTFEMLMQIAPAWPGGPLVKTRQEVSVVGKAFFKKFEQHSIIDSFGFEKR